MVMRLSGGRRCICFFCSVPASSELYTLSLHDALPILITASGLGRRSASWGRSGCSALTFSASSPGSPALKVRAEHPRSEEHTSELQSHSDLVCRLLLEKKKKTLIHQPPSRHLQQRLLI